MGGLSLLLMAGEQSARESADNKPSSTMPEAEVTVLSLKTNTGNYCGVTGSILAKDMEGNTKEEFKMKPVDPEGKERVENSLSDIISLKTDTMRSGLKVSDDQNINQSQVIERKQT